MAKDWIVLIFTKKWYGCSFFTIGKFHQGLNLSFSFDLLNALHLFLFDFSPLSSMLAILPRNFPASLTFSLLLSINLQIDVLTRPKLKTVFFDTASIILHAASGVHPQQLNGSINIASNGGGTSNCYFVIVAKQWRESCLPIHFRHWGTFASGRGGS